MKVSYNFNNTSQCQYQPSFVSIKNYGTMQYLDDALKVKISDIHSNVDFIKEFFDGFKKNKPYFAALVRKSYPNLIPQKDSGFTFKLKGDTSLTIMKGQSKKNLLWIQINDGSKFNGIILDGNDKAVVNYSENHPHMLPRILKYMSAEKIAEIKPENFIDTALQKIKNYAEFIKKVKNGETDINERYKQEISVMNKKQNTEKMQKRIKLNKSRQRPDITIKNIYRHEFNRQFTKEIFEKFSEK